MKKPIHSLKHNFLSLAVALAIIFAALGSGAWYIYKVATNNSGAGDSRTLSFAAEINSPKTYDQPLLIKLSDLALSISPLGASPASASTEKNVIKYLNAYANTDIVQTRYFNKIKEDIILKSPGHPDVFEYQIDLRPYDFTKDPAGNLIFYETGHQDDEAYRRFAIPAPFMIDADGKKSQTRYVYFELAANGRLTIEPSAEWLKAAKYPVILDPTIEITVLNVHSHPQQGENWLVDFTTQGTADLSIIPNDQATIDDDEFVSLSCGSETRTPQILVHDIIFYPNWQCDGTATVIHYTKKIGNHTLRFEFGGQVAYAYNTAVSTIVFRSPSVQPCNDSTACGANCSFGGLVYGTVVVGTTCWLDRNLGASQAATAYNDRSSYGWLYQWGRGSDGHQITSPQLSAVIFGGSNGDVPGNSNFIATTTSPKDWRYPQNDNLWQDVNGINNPCPAGFRLPTSAEWHALALLIPVSGGAGDGSFHDCNANCREAAASSKLKITTAGGRVGSNGMLATQSSVGRYWSSSPSGVSANYLYFDSTNVNPTNSTYRTFGYSVRCIKDGAFTTVAAAPSLSGSAAPIVFRSNKVYPCSINTVCGTSCAYNGDVYATILVGTQCWFAENLRTIKYPDGTSIVKGDPSPSSASWNNSMTAYYSCPPNTGSTREDCAAAGGTTKLGMLYQWNTVVKTGLNNATSTVATGDGPQGICPAGWQVPTDDNAVTSGLGKLIDTATTLCGAGNEGTCLKAGGASGFNIPLSGERYYNGINSVYFSRDSTVDLWSSSESSSVNAQERYFYTGPSVARYSTSKIYGLSVRCLQDTIPRAGVTSPINGVVAPIVFRSPATTRTCGADTTCGTQCNFGGLVYGTVVAEDGNCWLDRNLGASRAATAYNDKLSYGYYYQWGRGSDGHQIVSPQLSAVTFVGSDGDVPGHSSFIATTTSPSDWRYPQNGNLWQGVSGINNPCPAGFRLPTSAEWTDLITTHAGITTASCSGGTCRQALAASNLKIPTAGIRNDSNGVLFFQSSSGSYWSSSAPASPNVDYLYFASTSVNPANVSTRALGYSVRCLKD